MKPQGQGLTGADFVRQADERHHKGGMKVGFYGCTDQVVRIAWAATEDEHKAPRQADVECPACGNTHRVGNFMWRKPHSVEEFLLSELHLGGWSNE